MRQKEDFEPWNDREKEIIKRMNRRSESVLVLLVVCAIVGFITKLILG
jgi:hypothetical protein